MSVALAKSRQPRGLISPPVVYGDHDETRRTQITASETHDQSRVSVLVVGSNSVRWRGLSRVLSEVHDISEIRDTSNHRSVLEQARALQPDIVIVERSAALQDASILMLISELRGWCPASKCILVGSSMQPAEFSDLVDAGVSGIMLWRDLNRATLLQTLNAVLNGGIVVTSRSLPAELIQSRRAQQPPADGVPRLTPRERDILKGLAQGLAQKEIAAANGISVRTVKRTVACLEAKLSAPSAFALGAKAAALGLVTTGI